MALTLAHAESAWAKAEKNIQEFEASFLAGWFEPMIWLQFAMLKQAAPPEIKAQLRAMYPDYEDMIGE